MNFSNEELSRHSLNCELWINSLIDSSITSTNDLALSDSQEYLLTSEPIYSPEFKPRTIAMKPTIDFSQYNVTGLEPYLNFGQHLGFQRESNLFNTNMPGGLQTSTPQSWHLPGLRQRGRNWNPQESEHLVSIMNNLDVHVEMGYKSLRKPHSFWKKVSMEMTDGGFSRSDIRCKNRWKVLVEKYQKQSRE